MFVGFVVGMAFGAAAFAYNNILSKEKPLTIGTLVNLLNLFAGKKEEEKVKEEG